MGVLEELPYELEFHSIPAANARQRRDRGPRRRARDGTVVRVGVALGRGADPVRLGPARRTAAPSAARPSGSATTPPSSSPASRGSPPASTPWPSGRKPPASSSTSKSSCAGRRPASPARSRRGLGDRGGRVDGFRVEVADQRLRLRVALHAPVEQRVDEAAQGGDVAPPLGDEDARRPFLDPADEAGAGLVGGDPLQQEVGASSRIRSASSWSKASWTSFVSTQPK